MVDGFVYLYANNDGTPLTRCPECGARLTYASGINLLLSVAGQNVEVGTELTPDGQLMDTDDDAVANGYHVGTYCGECGINLAVWET